MCASKIKMHLEEDLPEDNKNTIYIENVPLHHVHQKEYLIKIFSTFGKIVKLEIEKLYENSDEEEKACGIIEFKKAKYAKKALKAKRLGPIKIKGEATQETGSNNNCNKNKIPLVDKNFALDKFDGDCLLHLYKFLQYQDILNLAQISKNQKSARNEHYKTMTVFNIGDINLREITLKGIEDFLIEYGPSIKDFNLSTRWNINFHKIVNFGFQYCPNLRIIQLSGIMYYTIKEQITTKYANLKTLRLYDSGEIPDKELLLLSKHYTELETLALTACVFYDGTILSNFKSLKRLDISQSYFNDPAFIKFCPNFENLISLNITESTILHTTECFDAIAKICKNLEMIEMSILEPPNHLEYFHEIGKQLGCLKNLKNLTLLNHNNIQMTQSSMKTPALLEFLNEITNTSLIESLRILKFRYCVFDEEHLTEIGKFKNLHTLMICFRSDEMEEIFWETMDKIINNLQILMVNIGDHTMYYKKFCIALISYLKQYNIKHNVKKSLKLHCNMCTTEYMRISKNNNYIEKQSLVDILPF